jgi:uncharacterized BrkB/YihY/UPF0761 family membrane protein
MVWLYLLALVIVFAAEVNVVAQRRPWPARRASPRDASAFRGGDERLLPT